MRHQLTTKLIVPTILLATLGGAGCLAEDDPMPNEPGTGGADETEQGGSGGSGAANTGTDTGTGTGTGGVGGQGPVCDPVLDFGCTECGTTECTETQMCCGHSTLSLSCAAYEADCGKDFSIGCDGQEDCSGDNRCNAVMYFDLGSAAVTSVESTCCDGCNGNPWSHLPLDGYDDPYQVGTNVCRTSADCAGLKNINGGMSMTSCCQPPESTMAYCIDEYDAYDLALYGWSCL